MKTTDINACRKAKLENRTGLKRTHPEMVGIGVGPKEKDGKPTGDIAVKLYVRKKVKEISFSTYLNPRYQVYIAMPHFLS